VKIGFYTEGPAAGIVKIIYIDDFIISPSPNCQKPLDVQVISISENSSGVVWAVGGAPNVEIEYGLSGFELGMGNSIISGLNPHTLTGLTAGLEYEIYVRDICGAADTSEWANSITFSTVCPTIFTPAYLNEFDFYDPTDSSIPHCWTQMEGTLGATNTVITNAVSSSWGIDDFSNLGLSNSASMSVYGTNQHHWLISPSIDLGTGNNYQLEFDLSLTNQSSTSATSFDANDTLAVVISTDNGLTWSLINLLQAWTVGNEPSNLGDFIAIDLSTYTGIVKFGFYTASPVHTEFKRVFIDNFQVLTTPSCSKPTDAIVSNINSNTVDIGWQNGASSVEIEYGP